MITPKNKKTKEYVIIGRKKRHSNIHTGGFSIFNINLKLMSKIIRVETQGNYPKTVRIYRATVGNNW